MHEDTPEEIDVDVSSPDHPRFSRRRFVRTGAAAGATALGLGSAASASAQSRVETLEQGDMSTVPTTEYFMYFNNQWDNPAQNLTVYGYDDGSVGWESDSSGSGINYPEVFCGHRAWGTDTGTPELTDVTIDGIDELTFSFDADVNLGGHWNLVEELWLLNGPQNQDGSTITHEVMIVCDYGGGHKQDHSPMVQTNILTDQFGNTFDFWDDITGGSGDRFLIFGLQNPTQTGQIDITPILEWCVDNIGDVQSSRRVSAVELGTELFDGASGDVTIDEFGVTINGSSYSTTGTDDGGQPPPLPGNLRTTEETISSISIAWDVVSEATEYDVYLDGSLEGTVSATSYTFDTLTAGTQYEVGVEAVNDAGTGDRVTITATTSEPLPETCEGADGGSATVNGRTVCDTDDDQYYEDFDADGEATQTDVIEFFQVQHRQSWKQPSMFDFSENGQVGHGDVVALFEEVTGNL